MSGSSDGGISGSARISAMASGQVDLDVGAQRERRAGGSSGVVGEQPGYVDREHGVVEHAHRGGGRHARPQVGGERRRGCWGRGCTAR